MPELSAAIAVLACVAGALLVVAGTAKLRAPEGTAAALGAARLPASRALVRSLGAVELLVGTAVLAVGGTIASAASAVLYAGFASFVVRQRRDVGAPCGCFGAERSPVTAAHVVVNVVATVVLVLAAVTATGPLLAGVGTDPLAAVAVVTLVATATWLVRLLLTAGAALRAAVELHPPAEVTR